MSYISPRQLFIQELRSVGVETEEIEFLADKEFDKEGDPLPGSIYETYRKAN